MIYFCIIIIISLVIIKFFKDRNLRIKIKTFFKRGISIDTGPWGVYCYCAKQGGGKTYSVVEFIREWGKDCKVYANLKSLENVDYTYISTFQDLLNIDFTNNDDKQIIIFYDEIFTALTKNTRMTPKVLSFLSQMRKRKIIFLTTAQEWLEINITLRRYVRFQIECSIYNFFKRSYIIKVFHDGEQLHWDNESNDYVAPIIETTISKMSYVVANSYDTYEIIDSSNNY